MAESEDSSSADEADRIKAKTWGTSLKPPDARIDPYGIGETSDEEYRPAVPPERAEDDPLVRAGGRYFTNTSLYYYDGPGARDRPAFEIEEDPWDETVKRLPFLRDKKKERKDRVKPKPLKEKKTRSGKHQASNGEDESSDSNDNWAFEKPERKGQRRAARMPKERKKFGRNHFVR
mmetsp:Transcript_1283/g.1945  ORF Transcript_1283/g.1945 Transcript_1283/m.1945 type:complete len:176 (-) Transcript_1283:162-689(-)